jgi:hypothetical protein
MSLLYISGLIFPSLYKVSSLLSGTDKFYLSLFGSLDKQALAKGGCRGSITKYFDKLK